MLYSPDSLKSKTGKCQEKFYVMEVPFWKFQSLNHLNRDFWIGIIRGLLIKIEMDGNGHLVQIKASMPRDTWKLRVVILY